MVSPSESTTPSTCPPSTKMSETLAKKRTSPPRERIFSRILCTTLCNKSVPIWGFASYKISSGAPAATNSSKTLRQRGSLMRVVNFPSEKVPAPPSPNCTLFSELSFPSSQKREMAFLRLSTSPPRSKIIGFKPISAKSKAANIPPGPKPTTTGRFMHSAFP
ncbi:hypothetical protein SDC9_165924 [bioreactor metagenome]|uniref:Uncharacterized protein n=1 Tax=bioreactor metagenome TaxID=1076179 RepID=A0A645G351_9ZZZZ